MTTSAVVSHVHPWQTRIVHAVAGGLVIYGLVFNGEDKPIATEAAFLTRELVAAALILIATVVRVIVVKRAGWRSALPNDAPAWEHLASRMVHRATYVLLGGTLVTGFAIAVFAPAAGHVPIWRLVAVPNVDLLSAAVMLHNIVAHLLGAAVLLHMAGALWHLLVRRDGVWSSMISRRP
jgi:cytochrome b561